MVRGRTRAVGAAAERAALDYLCANGLATVTTNFRCRLGEIDLVMRDHRCLVFVEVRYRNCRSLAPAGHTVDARKQAKLIRTAALFISRNDRLASMPMRFDVVAIDIDERGNWTIDWIRDAFRPADSSL